MAKNEIPHTFEGTNNCIVSCRWANWCGPNDLDYECTCEKECNDFDQFDIPAYAKKEAKYVRERLIRKAAELYREEVQQMKLMLNHFKRGAGDLINIETSVEQFKKKLMEQE